MVIKILLSQNPPPIPMKTKHYVRVRSPLLSHLEHQRYDIEEIPPPLPLKRRGYSMKGQNHWQHSPLNEHRRKSFSGSRNSISGLSRSSSSQSLMGSSNHSSLGRNGISGSNTTLSSRRGSALGSNNNLSPRRDSIFGSTNSLLPGRNSITASTGDLTGQRRVSTLRRKNSLSRSRESLNNNAIDDEITNGYFAKITKKKHKSHEIWLKVWKGCTFNCYSANYYDVYKKRALLEINMYRLKHKANILQMTPQMTELAQDLADQYLVKRKMNVKKYENFGILYKEVRLTAATTVVRDWYDTRDKYSFFLNKPSSEVANNFTQLTWRATKYFGISVQPDDDNLIIVCVFYPKGNIKGEYGRNVHKWTN
uniref:SCP domain-containing protein n=1 Tax=Strongyloides papillosus TaxID=174720 RepID=A0A0N5B1Z5_STREA